jgi:NADP-dependent 3-hydroxy acid dehydrogenase YdfG
MRDLKGRTVVITGASAGVGRAVAHRFAQGGARVVLIARDRQALMDVNDEVQKFGGRTALVAADVADSSAVFSAAGQIEKTLGQSTSGSIMRW